MGLSLKLIFLRKQIQTIMRRHLPLSTTRDEFQTACVKGHVETVRLFLANPKIDPTDDDNWAINHSSFGGQVEVVRLLLQDPRVDASRAESTNPEIQEMLAQWKYHPR